MSRSTRRISPPDDVWLTVDEWAASVVVAGGRPVAWSRSSCRLEARSDGYLDVLVPADEARAALLAAGVQAKGLRAAVARAGPVALPRDDEVAAALDEADVAFREVTQARRYAWRGPALAPVLLEIATTPDHAVVEAWWEDVFLAWPRLGSEGPRRPSPRRLTATAQVNRLLQALDQPPLSPPAAG